MILSIAKPQMDSVLSFPNQMQVKQEQSGDCSYTKHYQKETPEKAQ